MQLHQLRVFQVVARSRTFTEAAEHLGRSQPAVSMQVRALEAELGVPLVQLHSRRLQLTAAGWELLRHADRLLDAMGEAQVAMDRIRDGGGPLRIGATASPAIYLLPERLGMFVRRYPEVSLRLHIGNPLGLEEQLLLSEIDIAVAMGDDEDPPWGGPLEVVQVGREELRVVLPAGDSRAERDWTLKELRAERLIVREQGSHMRAVVDRALGRGFRPALELSSNEAVKRAVAAGLGISVLSEFSISWELEAGRLSVATCSALGGPRRTYVARRLSQRRLKAEAALWEALLATP